MGCWLMHSSNAQVEIITLSGGEMSYECIEKKYTGTEFEITLRLRRDCHNDAGFDSDAKVKIFTDSRKQCEYYGPSWILLKLVDKTKIQNSKKSCEGFCDKLCMEEAIYKGRVVLAPCPGGYTIAYQRCCRDEELDNIIDPGLYGGTWWVRISQQAIEACNNSPNFTEWTDRYICVDKSSKLDFSASEKDGDLLVYRLSTPNVGAERRRPVPNTSAPPYDLVEFGPFYSQDNFMGGAEPFKINRVTGIVSVTPETRGQFLIGVAVDEWRRGKWMSTVRSDYQIDVCGPESCKAPRDSVFVCYGETVRLLDLLDNFIPSEGCKYTWEPADDLVFDEDDKQCTNPEWIAQETRRFTVIAHKGNLVDTGFVYVHVNANPTIALSDTVFVKCLGADCVTVKGHSSADYQWDPVPEVSTDGDSLIFTFCNPPANRYYHVTTTSPKFVGMTDDDGFCTKEDSFYVSADPIIELFPDTICAGDTSGFLLQNRVACWTYDWAPTESLIFLDSFVRAIPAKTTTYYVTVSNNTEVEVDSVTVVVIPTDTVSIEVLTPGFLCEGRATMIGHTSGSTARSTFLWSMTPDFAIIESMEDTFHLKTEIDILTIYLTAVEQTNSGYPFCGADTTSFQLIDKTRNFEVIYLPIDTCFTDTTSVVVLDQLTGLPADSIIWFTPNEANWVDPDNLTHNPILIRAQHGQSEIVLYYETTFQVGCNVQDTLVVDISGDWTLELDTAPNFCGDTVVFTVEDMPKRNNATFTWYNATPGEKTTTELGKGRSLTASADKISEIFVTGEAFWCRDTVNVQIKERPKLSNVSVSTSRLCGGDTVFVVLSPIYGDSLTTVWQTNGQVVDLTDTSLMVVAFADLDSLRISYSSTSLVCPNISCDSMLVFPLDIIAPTKPIWKKIPCTYKAIVTVDTSVYKLGDVKWIVVETGDRSIATIDTLIFPGPGSYPVILEPGPKLTSCLFAPDTLIIVIPEFIRLMPKRDTTIQICTSALTTEESKVLLSVVPSIDSIGITWINTQRDTLGTGKDLELNVYNGLTTVYAISDADGCDCQDSVEFHIAASLRQFLIDGEGGSYCADKDFDGPSAYLFCGGDTITDVLYEWQPVEYVVSGQNSSSPVFNAPSTFQATVTIVDPGLTFAFDTVFNIEILEKPSVSIEVGKEKILVGMSTTLTAIPINPGPHAYLWSTGETRQTITVFPPENGETYRVTITDSNGCCDSGEVPIDPIPCRYDVPSAFSPNNDKLNDSFKVRSSCPLADFEMKNINRWGQEVFSTIEQEDGWDGSIEGRNLPPDVYAFCVVLRCPNKDVKETIVGDVTLLR